MLTDVQGQALAAYARASIREGLGAPEAVQPQGTAFDEPAATFVTLHLDHRLQGCIGSLAPRRGLANDVRANALAAAFTDPRARAFELGDVDCLQIELSLLSPLARMAPGSELEARARLRPGIDGVVLQCGRFQGTFLPQVWASLPDPRDFLRALKVKAGLAPDFWNHDLRLDRFTVQAWRDPPPDTPPSSQT